MPIFQKLYTGLLSRQMPETVAGQLVKLEPLATDLEIMALLQKRIKARSKHTSMPEQWFEPVNLEHKIKIARILFADYITANPDPRAAVFPDETDPERISQFIEYLSEALSKARGASSFLYARLDRVQRQDQKLGLNNHAYNKRFRLLNRMEAHLSQYTKETRFLSYRLAGKMGLVANIEYDRFASDVWSAAFIAYFSARKRRRSVFTNGSQDQPFDNLCAALLKRCEQFGADWALIARVFPEPKILARLNDVEKGQLMGEWLMVLRNLSEDLAEIWQRSDINLETMIVKPGNDSSSWNITAQAWNTARTAWLGLSREIGGDALLDKFLPGKVLRLMAADVAYWHQISDGGLHPDTAVWRKLPFPWEVMRGTVSCNRKTIEYACHQVGLNPVKSGWSAPKVSRWWPVAYKPTPELVHGVQIASPELATVLRKVDAFSGKAFDAFSGKA